MRLRPAQETIAINPPFGTTEYAMLASMTRHPTRSSALFLLLFFAAASTSCSRSAALDDGENPSCPLDAKGEPFSFVITNTGNRTLYLPYKCGDDLPIDVITADGRRALGVIHGNPCGVTCEQVYGGYDYESCTGDCGLGVADMLEPGDTGTVVWDRRVFEAHEAPAACSGLSKTLWCAMGVRVDDDTITEARLEICAYEPFGGTCTPSEEVAFDIDLSVSEVAIEIE